MTDSGHHCPFLNRADARCSKHHSIDQLGYAFAHCFGYYEGCGAYTELLAERRAWRARGHEFAGAEDGGGADGKLYENLTQLTVAGRHAQGAADPAVVSHAPRV
jgi:hypothetical protein